MESQKETNQRIVLGISTESDSIRAWAEHFITDRKVSNLTENTIIYYQLKLGRFIKYCIENGVENIGELTPSFLRGYLEVLASTHTPGGVLSYFRAVRSYLYWYEAEVEPEGWKNPIRKVRTPKVPELILEPVEASDLQKMLAVCRHSFLGARDSAMLMVLADTGLRASELLSLNREDVNVFDGGLLVRQGKGRKPRQVYLGERGRKALRAYMRKRTDTNPCLWINQPGERLQYWGLKMAINRLAKRAGVKKATPHMFRRFYALQSLRNGADIVTLSRSMGHTNLEILKRYLKQTSQDIKEVHARTSPVDRL